MTFVDAIGWLAALLTLATFAMKTMIPLRLIAISSNISFIAYGALAGFYPALALHCVLLPFNIYRVIEMRRLVTKVEQAAEGDLSTDWFKFFMSPTRFNAGDIVFNQGDEADRLYVLAEGKIYLREIDQYLEKVVMFGEIAFFSPDRKRTLTAECAEACTVLSINESSLKQLYYQSPDFGFYLVRLIARRLVRDRQRMAARLHEA